MEDLKNKLKTAEVTMLELVDYSVGLFATIDHLKNKIKDIEGDIVETGVWRGGACIYMAHVFPDRNIWVCDSFKGLPKAEFQEDMEDYEYAEGWYSASLDEVKENFIKFNVPNMNRIFFIEGWFKDTLPIIDIKKIALLRLDGDLYSSTMDALTYLYPKVSDGGAIIFDDSSVKGAYAAVYDYIKKNSIENIKMINPATSEVVDGAGYLTWDELNAKIYPAKLNFLVGLWWIKNQLKTHLHENEFPMDDGNCSP